MSSPEDESSRRYTAMVDCQAELRTVRAERDDLRIQLAESRELLREENRRHQKAAAERDALRAKLADAEGRNDVLARITDALRAQLAMAQAKLAVWEAK